MESSRHPTFEEKPSSAGARLLEKSRLILGKRHLQDEKLISTVKQAVLWIKKAHNGSTQWVTECTERQFYYYCLLKKLKWYLWIPAKCSLLFIMMFEEPASCAGSTAECSSMNKHFYSSEVSVIPLNISAGISIVLYCIILCRINLRRLALGDAWKFHNWIAFNLTFSTLGLLGAIGYWVSPTIFVASFICRPLVFLGSTKKLRQSVVDIVTAIPRFIDVLVSLFFCVFLFTCVGMVLFVRTPEGAGSFPTWTTGWVNMWILFTTANCPNMFIPAFISGRMTFIFFFIYLIVSMYLLGNVLLAKVYDAYKTLAKEDMQEFLQNKHWCIGEAFRLLAGGEEKEYIAPQVWAGFLVEYCDPAIGGIQVEDPLDTHYNSWRANIILQVFHGVDASKGMSREQFESTVAVFLDSKTYIAKRRPPAAKQQVSVMRAALQTFFTSGVTIGGLKIVWDKVMDCVIVIGTLSTMLLAMWFVLHKDAATGLMMTTGLYWVVFGFSVLYTLSLTAKLIIVGFERFWYRKPFMHRFDFFNVYGLILAEILYMLVWQTEDMERMIILLSFARSLRLLSYIGPFKHLFFMIQRLIPTYWQMGMMLVVVFYVFMAAGQLFFGGQIYNTNPALANTAFAQSDFWQLNFNDTAGSWVTLFAVMVVNNWYIIAYGYVASSGTMWALVYFILFFVVVNLIVLNILMALILESTAVLSEEIEAEDLKQSHHDTPMDDLEKQASGSGARSAEKMLMKVLCADEHFDDHFHNSFHTSGAATTTCSEFKSDTPTRHLSLDQDRQVRSQKSSSSRDLDELSSSSSASFADPTATHMTRRLSTPALATSTPSSTTPTDSPAYRFSQPYGTFSRSDIQSRTP